MSGQSSHKHAKIMPVNYFKIKTPPFSGSSRQELFKKARRYYKDIITNPRRKPAVRCKVLGGEKVFLEMFWQYIGVKNAGDRGRRVAYFNCAIELIKNTNCKPSTKIDPNSKKENLQLGGITQTEQKFIVHIKRDGGHYYLMSVFPE
jgi:hypothetical protein